jgi:hypothetical protein
MKAVVAHQPFDPFLARRETPRTPFAHHARTAVGILEFGMDRAEREK